VPLEETIRVPDLSQRPPDRLDVVVVESDVGVVEIDPEPDPLGQPIPVLHVGEHRLPAALVELRDPVLLDLGLGADPELALDLELDRQPVAVPARLAGHPVAAHRAIARIDVLEDAREDVGDVRLSVCGRRPLVEAPGLGSLAGGERAGKDVALAPALEDTLLERRERLLRVDSAEAGHEAAILGWLRAPPDSLVAATPAQ
jgi:hypothetical protein